MIEKELDDITSEIGGIEEFQSYLVRVHLKQPPEGDSKTPEGHIPCASYISNNVLTLFTSADLSMPLFLIPPPMIRYIEVMRASGGYGVMLLCCGEKIPCIKNIRDAFQGISSDGETIGLKEAKTFAETAPVLLVENIDLSVAEKFLSTLIATRNGRLSATATLTFNGTKIEEQEQEPEPEPRQRFESNHCI